MMLRISLVLVGNIFLLLAGVAAGLCVALYGLSAERLPAFLQLPDVYYPVAAGLALGMAVLLRKAAVQIA